MGRASRFGRSAASIRLDRHQHPAAVRTQTRTLTSSLAHNSLQNAVSLRTRATRTERRIRRRRTQWRARLATDGERAMTRTDLYRSSFQITHVRTTVRPPPAATRVATRPRIRRLHAGARSTRPRRPGRAPAQPHSTSAIPANTDASVADGRGWGWGGVNTIKSAKGGWVGFRPGLTHPLFEIGGRVH